MVPAVHFLVHREDTSLQLNAPERHAHKSQQNQTRAPPPGPHIL